MYYRININNFEYFLNSAGVEIKPDIFLNYLLQYYNNPFFISKIKTKSKKITNLNSGQCDNTDQCNFAASLEKSNAAIGPSLIVTSDALKSYIKRQHYGSEILNTN